MKLLRSTVLLLIILFLLGAGAVALATPIENWTTDPATGSQICVVFWDDSMHLVSASWSGPAADGKAEGKGLLNFVYKDKSGKEIKAQADAEMKAGKLNGMASVKWSTGSSYEGHYKEGVFFGQGVYKGADGAVIEGEWANGSLNGKGSMRFPDGRSYEGDFVEGVPNGKVFYKLTDGRTYEGDMVKWVFQGKGIMRFPNGAVQDGDWANGLPNGKGILRMANGVVYEGDFVNGKRTGKGVQRFPDGSRYEGDFLNDAFNGSGTLYDPDGKILKQGKWKNDQFIDESKPVAGGEKPVTAGGTPVAAGGSPAGTAASWATDPNTGCRIGWVSDDWTLVAASWTGPAVDGKAEGTGTLTVTMRGKDGKSVKGIGAAEMKTGKLDGHSTLKFSDGDSYDGYYKEGLRDGHGLYKLGVGGSYEGEFRAGKANGQGVFRDTAGVVIYEGEWKNDYPDIPPKTDKVLGIPWWAPEDEANKIMLARPGTSFKGAGNFKNYKQYVYVGPYNDELACIRVAFYQGKMFAVVVELFTSEDGVMAKYNTVRQGLTGRYGQPFRQEGKYLDTKNAWELGGGYRIGTAIKNETEFVAQANVPAWQHKPFGVLIAYAYTDTWNLAVQSDIQRSSKDY